VRASVVTNVTKPKSVVRKKTIETLWKINGFRKDTISQENKAEQRRRKINCISSLEIQMLGCRNSLL
jgi:hypothetical protein